MLQTYSAEFLLSKVLSFSEARLQFLKELVEQNSYTDNIDGVNQVQSRLENSFWALGMHTERIPCAKRGDILVAKSAPNVKEAILLVGHADTVHSPTNGFQGFVQTGDVARGPGVYDMKSGLVQILLILDTLKSLNLLSQIPLKIIINSAEENSTAETIQKMKDLSVGASCALVFELGRDNDGIVVERKGIIELWITSEGKESHSGNGFSDGTNAIVPLIDAAKFAAGLTNLDQGVTVNVAQISGGSHFCVVPGAAKVAIEVRAGTDSGLDAVLKQINEYCEKASGLSVRVDTKTSPLNKLPKTNDLVKRFIAAGEFFGRSFHELPRVGGLSDANIIGSIGIPTIDALGPTGGGAHTKEEFVKLDSIVPRAAVVTAFLLKN